MKIRRKLEESSGKVSASHMQILSILPFPPVCPSLSAHTKKMLKYLKYVCEHVKKSDRGFFDGGSGCVLALLLHSPMVKLNRVFIAVDMRSCVAIKSMNYERA